ncbi:MAG: ROK family protein [Bacteroidota bacterium]
MSAPSTNTDAVIGIDLGGTSVKAGVVRANGEILYQVKLPTLADKGPLVVRRQIVQAVEDLLHRYPGEKIAGIGIGTPGMVSLDGESVKAPPNFADWHDYRLKEAIQSSVGLPVELENDANAAAIGEARFGAGRGRKNFVFVIWGTGVGGGIIADGQIFRGAHGGAGEIGHTTIDHNGPQCNCGNKGCIEAFIGQRYLSVRTRERLLKTPSGSIDASRRRTKVLSRSPATRWWLRQRGLFGRLLSEGTLRVGAGRLDEKQHPGSKIVELVDGDLSKLEPAILSKAMDLGDELAREILVEAGSLLGIALASVMNILDIRYVIIGGGVSAAGEPVFEAVRKSIRERAMGPIRSSFQVGRAELGNDAGLLGAASLALSASSGRPAYGGESKQVRPSEHQSRAGASLPPGPTG